MQTAIPLCTTKLLPTAISSNSDYDAFKHQRNLANNIGGVGRVGKRAWLLRTLIYEGVKLERGETLV